MPKKRLRQHLTARRREMAPHDALESSAAISTAVVALPAFATAHTVAVYAAIAGEVDVSAVAAAAIGLGKRVCFPAVATAGLVFRGIADPAQLIPGAFNIPEPPEWLPAVEAAEIDLVIVPGVAFDIHCRRLGYGKGYYDRTFHSVEGSGRLCGVCFDFQLVAELPAEPHDVVMDCVVTERRVVVSPATTFFRRYRH